MQPASTNKAWPIRSAALALPAALLLFATRDAILVYAACALPFWDEWDGGFHVIRTLAQNVFLENIFATHNEHRFVFTRLLIAAIYGVAGYYDVVLQMIVNAIIGSVTVAWIIVVLCRKMSIWQAAAVLGICTAITDIPFTWENILLGFNTHFYLLLAFSFAGLLCLYDARAYSVRWFGGVTLLLASFFTMASGALTIGNAACLSMIQMACGARERSKRESSAVAVLLVLLIFMIWWVPRQPQTETLRAQGALDAVKALILVLSWPAKTPLGLLFCAPAFIFSLRVIAKRPPVTDSDWMLVATFGWTMSQFVALAIGRAASPVESRYLDINLVGICVSTVSMFRLLGHGRGWHWAMISAWLALLFFSSVRAGQSAVKIQIPARFQDCQIQTANVLSYLSTRDISVLKGKPLFAIPYPSAERLKEALDDPTFQNALPPLLNANAVRRPIVETAKAIVLRGWWLFLAMGGVIALFNLRMIWLAHRPRQRAPS